MSRDADAAKERRRRGGYEESRKDLVPPTEGGCDATVAVIGKVYSMQRLTTYNGRKCCRKGKEKVGHLFLCTVHARMAWDGLLDETGDTGSPTDLAVRRMYPKKRYTWMPKIDPIP